MRSAERRGWKILATVSGSGSSPYRIGLKEDGTLGCSCKSATAGKYRFNVLADKHMIDFAHKLNGEPTHREVVLVGAEEDLAVAGALLRLQGTMTADQRT